MVVADPLMTADDAPAIAQILSTGLDIDYFRTLRALRGREEGSRFEYVARRVPSTLATDVLAQLRRGRLQRRLDARTTRSATTRPTTWPPTCSASWAPTSRSAASSAPSTSSWPARTARPATRSAAATGCRWGRTASSPPATARRCAPRSTSTSSGSPSGCSPRRCRSTAPRAASRVVMDTRTGELLALADAPTFDANEPLEADKEDLGSRALSDAYEPGLGGEGAHRRLAHRRRQGDAAAEVPRPAAAAPPGPPDRRLVRPRQHQAHDDRHPGQVVQHRHRPRRRRVHAAGAHDVPALLRPRRAHRRRRPRRVARHPHRRRRDDLADQGPRRLRPVALGQRRADDRGRQHHRQRRRAHRPQPRSRAAPPPTRASRSAPTTPRPPGSSASRPPARPPG